MSEMFVLTNDSLLLTSVSLDSTPILAYPWWSNALIFLAFNLVKVGVYFEGITEGTDPKSQVLAAKLLATIKLS